MKLLFNLSIGTRLGVGFAFVLSLSVIGTAIAYSNAATSLEQTRQMMDKPLANERLASDLNALMSAAIVRTSILVRSNDAELADKLANDVAEGTRGGGELLGKLEQLMTTPEEKNIFARTLQVRAFFQKAKTDIVKLKGAVSSDEVERKYGETFMPAARAYQEQVRQLLVFQRQRIDDAARRIEASTRNSNQLMIGLTMLMLLSGAFIAHAISRSITQPVKQALHVATTVASGDLSLDLPEAAARDEIGELMSALKHMNEALRDVVGEVQDGTQVIALASREIAEGNHDLSSRTEHQASSLEETASSMEQLTATVRQNADSAQHANQQAKAASEVAARGGRIVSEVVVTMEAINASSQRIADIISVIDGIAFQTNILALNAAVEAARAGEQGRGFAVVASEVRNLAHRAASAAKEIKDLIDSSVLQVVSSTALVQRAGTTIEEVVSSVQRLAQTISEITAASREQSVGIDQVNIAVVEMDNFTQQNAAMVEEAAATASSLQQQAAKLADVAARFKLGAGNLGDGRAPVQRTPLALPR
ncbi:methyl-accepting chemotaxis protein [Undibacterium sp. KW1]|uniref:methyl-accepting chemotaxis protein n=1 Tax=Undibacterium sp. KW1 TaxID=2058624 RepID=UPI001331D1E7|nr:methyl-accepting chemotaxis protein [Undibacterium sp. KW1]BBB62402.1 methyl-accepting chemotaxis protein [Undibacterium sp. KW1]